VVIVGNHVLLSLEHGVAKPVLPRHCYGSVKSCDAESGTWCH
jgi:hypothetical protein